MAMVGKRATEAVGMRGVDYSTRVDKVGTRARVVRSVQIVISLILALVMLIPVFWMASTAFKLRADAIAVPPKVFYQPTLSTLVE